MTYSLKELKEKAQFGLGANPETVLALIEDLERAREALKQILKPKKDIGLGCSHEYYAREAIEKMRFKE